MSWTIPGTTVTASVLPAAPHSGYSAVYRPAAEAGPRLFSVNAGNPDSLEVGLGGINAAFAADIVDPGSYGGFHRALLEGALGSGEVAASIPPLLFSYVAAPTQVGVFRGRNEGVAIVDVFGAGDCPNANDSNAAMLYACPPDGRNPAYANDASFLAAVTAMAVSIVEAAGSVNDRHATRAGGPIPVIRMCAYSSSIFLKPGSPVAAVVESIYVGLSTALKVGLGNGITHVEFPHGSGFDAFASTA